MVFGGSGCAGNNIQMSLTLILGIFMHVIVLFRTRKDASVLTSALVFSYNLYLQWSALSSKEDESCNPYLNSATNTTLELILGLFFTFASLLVISASTQKEENLTTQLASGVQEKEEEGYEKVGKVNDMESGGKKVTAEQMHVFPISSATIYFQLLLVLASIYYAMLLTNWGSPTILDSTAIFFDKNSYSFWIQLGAQWISISIYIFSLTAPLCFPDRDFGA